MHKNYFINDILWLCTMTLRTHWSSTLETAGIRQHPVKLWKYHLYKLSLLMNPTNVT